MFDLIDTTLHQMALPVPMPVVLPLHLAVGSGRDHWNSSASSDQLEEGVRVISLVPNYIVTGVTSDQPGPLGNIMAFSSRQLEPQGITQSIYTDVDFGAEAAPAPTQSLGRLTTPFFEAPAAPGWARTMVLSMSKCSMSGSWTKC